VWNAYGTVDGVYYATPLGANVKSLVWYSPQVFRQHNWAVPQTWDELMALSDRIAKSKTNIKPWCAGIESGGATGWPATDWVEDVLLRTQPPEVYDQWWNHQIPFNDPRIVSAIDEVGKILRNPDWVNGGFGDVASIANTSFQDGGLPIVDSGECAMHKQGNFLANEWPSSVEIGENGDVYAFSLPGRTPDDKPVLVAGEFLATFNSKPETQAVQLYMSSPEFTNKKAKMGEWISANKGLSPANLANPIDKLAVEALGRPGTVRFDASDMMPAAVGAKSFWTEMTAWIKGKSTKAVADDIEASWPR
jgi:alpha-glucoside transport system substrate-binding protein